MIPLVVAVSSSFNAAQCDLMRIKNVISMPWLKLLSCVLSSALCKSIGETADDLCYFTTLAVCLQTK